MVFRSPVQVRPGSLADLQGRRAPTPGGTSATGKERVSPPNGSSCLAAGEPPGGFRDRCRPMPGRVASARTLVTPAAPRRPGPGAGALDAVKAVPPRGPRGAWTRGRTLPLLRIVFAGVTESTRETPGGWRSISCCSAARCIAARRPVEVSTRYRGPPCFASNVRPLSSMQPRFLQR